MPSNKPGSRLIRAAGGVAWRPGPDNEPEVLLVHRKKYDDWSLPKGKVEPGEALPVTAVREVMEEGGARLALGRRLASVRYNVGGRPKRVHYWVARVLSVDAQAVPNHEVDEITWLPADRAVAKVSYRRDHGVLAEFAARPPETVPLILLRHAKALPKHGWKRADDVRPLDDTGRSDAKTLADLLTCFGPRPRLVSSTAIRCLETLLPLAELTGQTVQPEPCLYVHYAPADDADPEAELAALVREAVASGQPVILCAHRENIPALRRAALAVLAAPPGAGRAGDPAGLGPVVDLPDNWDGALPPGGFWVLNIAPLPASAPPGPGNVTAAEPGEAALAAAPDPEEPAAPAEVTGAAPEPASRAGRPQSPHSLLTQRRSRWWQRFRSRSSSRAQASEEARLSEPVGDYYAADDYAVQADAPSAARVPQLVASAAGASAAGAAGPGSAAGGARRPRIEPAVPATDPEPGTASAPGQPADSTPADGTPADGTPADNAPAGADPDVARGPFGILVSADRYDVSD